MKLHLNLTLRRSLLAAFTAVATLSTGNVAQGSVLYSSVGMQTYTDFGQNYGRYQAGRVNDLLSSIRERDKGIVIYYIGDKFTDYTYTMEHGMIDFSSSSYASVDAAIGYGFLATVQHNGVQNPSYAAAEVGEANAVRYAGIEYRNGNVGLGQAANEVFLYAPKADHKITRLSKLVTDARTSDVYNDMSMLGKPLTGELLYRAGSGTMFMAEVDADGMANSGAAPSIRGAYDYVTGGLTTIDSWGQRETQEGGDFNYSVYHTVNDNIYAYITGTQESGQVNPLPYIAKGGDSGSPSWVWNEAAGQYQYISALQSGGGNFSQDIGAWSWELEKMESFNRNIELGSDSVIHLTGVTDLGDTITGNANGTTLTVQQHLGSIVTGGETTQFAGVQSGVNTWNNLNDIKDNLNWYNYGNEKLNANGDVNRANEGKIVYGELMYTDSIVLKASSATPYTVQLDDTVDTGIGYVRFSKAEGVENATFNLVSEAGEQNQLNSAGFVVDKGVTLDVSLTGDSSYLREWRKVGDGDLRISGNGNNFVLLNVGGGSVGTNDGSDAGHASGKVYLDREDGYAAYNVLASTGSTVILKNTAQVAHDVTLGAGGATLDLNGNDYTWNNATTADGFTLHMLTEKDILANHGSSTATVTIKNAGESLLGSFEDSASGALKVIYDGGSNALAMHSVFTDLTKNNASGFTVKSGSVSLGGTMTVHGRGSLTGTNADRVENPNDWHYADAAMNVTVQNGGTFTLDSHARLTGDVTVEQGGTFVMKEGTKHQYEYIEGAIFTEDTQSEFYSRFHGLKGDIKLQGGALQVAYNEGTDSHNTYAGNITGEASAVSIDLGTEATLSLSGNNNFTVKDGGSVQLNSGNVIAENAAAAGYSHDGTKGTAAHKWLVGEQASLAVKGLGGNEALKLIDDSSNGVLALSQNQTAQVDVGTYAPNLLIGAMAGDRIEYGTQGTTEALEATIGSDGSERWLLGGGGGELVVNFALQNDNAALVLGNEYTTGSVTLTNEKNHFGSITFAGRVTLGYTSEAALGNSHINLAYGHRIIGSESALNNIDGGSTGAMLLDNMAGSNVSVATHPTLALGATGDVSYSGTIALGDSDTYRFGAVTGKLALTNALTDNDKATHLEVDGQHYSGGVVELKQAATLTGDVTVMGYNRERSEETGGDITLRLSAANALAAANSVALKDGGILDVNGTRQQLNNLSMAAGSTLTDSTHGNGSAVLNVSGGVTTALEGSVDVASLTKMGAGTLNLGGTNSYAQFNIAEGKVALKSNTALQNAGITNVQSGAVLDATAVSTGGQIALSGGELKVGGSLNGVVQAVSGTSVMGNSSGISEISAEIGTNAGATLKLVGGTIRLTNGSINADSDNGTEIVKSGTLSVTANRLAINNSATADIGGTLSFDAEAKQSLYSNRGGDNTTRNIAHLNIGGGADKELEISEETWNTIWNIHALTGEGKLSWQSNTTHWYSSRIVLDGENDFSGTILAKRNNTASSVRSYASYLELAHDQAAKAASISLEGTNATHNMSLAVNTENAHMLSLSGNEFSAVYAGAANPGVGRLSGEDSTTSGGLNDVPTSTRQATITFTGDGTATYAGNVYGGADGNGISLVMNGATAAATQNFTGSHIDLNDITVQKGTLNISSAGLNIAGNVSIASGAALTTGDTLNLRDGQTLSVTGDGNAPATLDSVLALNGGALAFDGATLSGEQYALSVQGVTNNASGLTLNFFNTSYLVDRAEYKLVSGDWSALNLGDDFFTVTGMEYLTSTLTKGTDGLSVTFSLMENCFVWDGDSKAHTWSDTSFGQQQRTTTAEDILVFNDSASSPDVVVMGTQQARTLVFDTLGLYTVDTTNGSVQTTDVDVYNEGKATLGSGVTVSGEALIGKGTLTVTDTATLEQAQSVHGGGTLVIDWGSESGSVANLGEIGSLHLASGRLETAKSLETTAVTIDKGAALATAASQTAAISVAGAGREGTDDSALSLRGNVTFSGAVTLTDDATVSVSAGNTAVFSGGVNAEEHTLTKTGAGTMDIAVGTSGRAQGITVDDGELVLHRNNAAAKTIGTLSLNNGATLTQYSDNITTAASAIGTLVMGVGTGTIKTTYFDGSLQLGTLKLADGVSAATLNLENNSAVERYTLFSLGRAGAEVGNFAGTINLSSTYTGNYRSATIVVNRGDITRNAIVNLASSVSESASLALGLHDGTVTVAGLESGQPLGSRAYVYSGYSVPTATKVTKENTVRTLTIATAAETDATFYGAVEENINIVKSGAGTQRFAGNSVSVNFNGTIAVQDGTLGLYDVKMLRQATDISVAESGTLMLNGMMTLSTPAIHNEGSVIFGDNTQYILLDIDTPASYTLLTGSGSTEGLSLANFSYNGVSMQGYSAGVKLLFSDNAVTLRITETPDSRTITWNGTEESAVWDNGLTSAWIYESDATESYHRTDSVVFDAEGCKNVAIAAGTATNAMTVQAGDYSFTGMEGLTVNGALRVEAGASAAFDTLPAAHTANLTADGAVTAGATAINSGTAIFNGSALFTDGIRIDGGTTTFNGAVTIDATAAEYEMVINRGDISFNHDVTVKGKVQLGANSNAVETVNNVKHALANITIGKGATFSAGDIVSPWGFNKLTVDGILNTTHLDLATGTTQTITGSGTINADKLTGRNAGVYNFSNLRLNIGEGGMDGGQPLSFTDMTLGALDNWTADRTIDLAGAIVIDTAKVGSESGEGATVTLKGLNVNSLTSLTKTGAGTLVLSNAMGSYSGSIAVNQGTMKIGNAASLGQTDNTITIAKNGVLDVNGCPGTGPGNEVRCYTVNLNGGTLTNTGRSVGASERQVVSGLRLAADSSIHAESSHDFGLIASGWGDTSIALNAYTLEKTGAGTYYITNAAITGSGKLKVSEGTLQFDPKSNGHLDSGIEMAGGTLAGTVKLGDSIALDITKSSTLSAAIQTEGHTLTVNNDAVASEMSGALTGAGKLVKTGTQDLTLTNGSANFTGGAEVQQGTLRLSGSAVGMMDRLTSLSVAEDATLHLATSGSYSDKNWDASQVLGNIELGNGTDSMTVNATAFSALNDKATLIINKNAQYDGNGTGAAPATLNNDLVLRGDATRNSVRNVDVFNGNIAIEGSAIIAAHQYGVARALQFNGAVSGDTLVAGSIDSGCGQQFYIFSAASDISELEHLDIRRSAGNWTNVIAEGEQSLAQKVTFAEASAKYSRLFVEADNTIDTLQSKAGDGFMNIAKGAELKVKELVDFGGELHLGGELNRNSTASGLSVGNSLLNNADYVTITGNGDGKTARMKGEILLGTDADTQTAYITGKNGTRIEDTLIDLAEGTHLHLQDIVLAANSKLTDATAFAEMQNVHVETQVGVNAEFTPNRVLAAGSTLSSPISTAEPQTITTAQDESLYSLTLNNVSNVQVSGSGLVLDLSGVSYETLQNYTWVGVTLSDAGTFDTTATEVYMTSKWSTADGYFMAGDTNTVFFRSADIIPEPATATLSLLALAALAARRRRK